jgi:hypothetical protein
VNDEEVRIWKVNTMVDTFYGTVKVFGCRDRIRLIRRIFNDVISSTEAGGQWGDLECRACKNMD